MTRLSLSTIVLVILVGLISLNRIQRQDEKYNIGETTSRSLLLRYTQQVEMVTVLPDTEVYRLGSLCDVVSASTTSERLASLGCDLVTSSTNKERLTMYSNKNLRTGAPELSQCGNMLNSQIEANTTNGTYAVDVACFLKIKIIPPERRYYIALSPMCFCPPCFLHRGIQYEVIRSRLKSQRNCMAASHFSLQIKQLSIYILWENSFRLGLKHITLQKTRVGHFLAPTTGGGLFSSRGKKMWLAKDLTAFVVRGRVQKNGEYRFLDQVEDKNFSLNESSILVDIPLISFVHNLTGPDLKLVAGRHSLITTKRKISRERLMSLLLAHECQKCSKLLSMFALNESSHAQRQAEYKKRRTEEQLKEKNLQDQARRHSTPLKREGLLIQKKKYYHHKQSKFPPSPPSNKLVTQIINGWCFDSQWDNLQEAGCAVCGTLTSVDQLTPLQNVNVDLKCLQHKCVTRCERVTSEDSVKDIPGPVLDPACRDICDTCLSSLQNNQAPELALANGFWLGAVPTQLQGLTWMEQRLIARIAYNYCVVRVYQGAYKMRANAVCHSIPMPRVYKVLPPPRKDLDEVLAFVYIGPSKPTLEDYKRTPFLVRRNRVAEALKWLILNHTDYREVEYSEDNMKEYPETEPAVYVNY